MNNMMTEWLKTNDITICDTHTEEESKNRDTIKTDMCGNIKGRTKTHSQKLHDAKYYKK